MPARAPRSRSGAAPGNGALLPIDEVAQAAGTVGYELMCALAARAGEPWIEALPDAASQH